MQLQPFFEWLLRTTLQASLLICLILLFQVVLRSRLGARWHYCLWLLLLIRMAMPWAPQSRVSMFNLIPQLLPQRQTEYARQEVGDDSADSDVADKSTAESTTVSTTGVPQDSQEAITTVPEIGKEAQGQLKPVFSEVADILPLIWLTGALALAVYVCAGNFNLLRIVKRERPLTDQKILDLLEDCKAEMGIRIILGIVTTDKVKSPALFGFIRPRLLLPKGMLETLSREELRYVFLHELAHLKRHDIYIGWLISLLQVLHWFNPLIWLAFYRLRADRELACDALVLARTQSGQAKDYGRTIVSLLERFSRSQRLPAMAGILETKAQLKRRIIMITRFKKNSYRWSPLAVILIIILACVSLPDAKRTRASETLASKPAHQTNFRKIRIPTKIFWDAQLSPDGQKVALASDGKLWIMPLSGKLGPEFPGAPVKLNTGDVEVSRFGFAWSADGRWIAFNENYETPEILKGVDITAGIYVVPDKGGKPKKVYENNRGALFVNYGISLSPHGKTLAFSSVDGNEVHICAISVDGGLPKQLVDASAREPTFSPDGKMIAYVEGLGGGLWVMPAHGGTPKLVADAGNALSPIWSPDGKMIAFIDYEVDQICIIPIGEDGEATGEMTTIDPPEGIEEARLLAGWTPDKKIGAIFQSHVEYALYTLPVKGGMAALVTHGGFPSYPRWSPDGKRIFHTNVADDGSGAWQRNTIAFVPAEGGKVTTVPIQSDAKIRSGGGNRVSPDGTMIVFSGMTQESSSMHIWTLPVEGGKPKQLTKHPEESMTERFPCWSPDGKAIAFVRARRSEKYYRQTGEMNIYIVQLNGGEPKPLKSESDHVAFGPIAWSPDGRLLAYFSRYEASSPDGTLKVIPVDGGESRVVGKVQNIHLHKELAWSPNSKRIAFNGPKYWDKVIKVISLNDGSIVDIETNLVDTTSIYHLDWSPDGESLVFAGYTGGGPEFWLMENFLSAGVSQAK